MQPLTAWVFMLAADPDQLCWSGFLISAAVHQSTLEAARSAQRWKQDQRRCVLSDTAIRQTLCCEHQTASSQAIFWWHTNSAKADLDAEAKADPNAIAKRMPRTDLTIAM